MNDSGPIGPVIEIRRRGMLVATIPMEGERLAIGRSSSSHIRLEDNRVSRSHAAIERQHDGSFILIDLGSRAGTQLDGRRVTSYVPMPVSNHSKIGLIEYELIFRQLDDRTAALDGPRASRGRRRSVPDSEGCHAGCLSLSQSDNLWARRWVGSLPSTAGSQPDSWGVAQTSRSSSKKHSTGCSRSFRWPRAALSCFPSRRASFPRWLARPVTGVALPGSIALYRGMARLVFDSARPMLVSEVPIEPPVNDWDIPYS